MSRGVRFFGLLVAVIAPALLAGFVVVLAWRGQEAEIERAAFDACDRGACPRHIGAPPWDPILWAMIVMSLVALAMLWLLGRASGRRPRTLAGLLIPGWNLVLGIQILDDLASKEPALEGGG